MDQPKSPPIDASHGPLLRRLFYALLLRRAFYDAVAADRRATAPAGAVVCLAALARESVGLYEVSQAYKAWGLLLLLVAVFALMRWVVYAAVMYPIARGLSGRPIEYARLLRCLGFAETPAVLSVLAFVLDERLTPFITFAVGAWLLAATIVAVRAATGVPARRAAVIGVLGFATYLGLGMAVDIATQLTPAHDVEPAGEHAEPAALTLRGTL